MLLSRQSGNRLLQTWEKHYDFVPGPWFGHSKADTIWNG
jgi:hypothetical protein